MLQAPRGRGSETCPLGFPRRPWGAAPAAASAGSTPQAVQSQPHPSWMETGKIAARLRRCQTQQGEGSVPSSGRAGVQPRGSVPPKGCCSSMVPRASNHSFSPAPRRCRGCCVWELLGRGKVVSGSTFRLALCQGLSSQEKQFPSSLPHPCAPPHRYLQQRVIKHSRGWLLLDDDKCSLLT